MMRREIHKGLAMALALACLPAAGGCHSATSTSAAACDNEDHPAIQATMVHAATECGYRIA